MYIYYIHNIDAFYTADVIQYTSIHDWGNYFKFESNDKLLLNLFYENDFKLGKLL